MHVAVCGLKLTSKITGIRCDCTTEMMFMTLQISFHFQLIRQMLINTFDNELLKNSEFLNKRYNG